MRRSTAVAWAVSAFFAGACAGGETTASDTVRTDSAGVRISTSGATDRDLPWHFERGDVLRDSLGEPWLLNGVNRRRVHTNASGGVFLLTDEQRVAEFDGEGRVVRLLGRKGSGPGEMEFPVSVGAQGDTVWAHDVMRSGLVRWGPAGAPLPNLPLTGALASTEEIAFHANGFYVHQRDFDDGVYTLALVSDTLGTPPLQRVVQPPAAMIRMCNGGISLPPFFSPVIRWSTSGGRVAANAEPAYILWLYDAGRPVASVRRAVDPRAPVPADADLEYPDGFKVMFGNATQPCTLTAAEVFAQAGAAPLLPLVQDLALAPDGTLWVQRTLRGDTAVVLDVFDGEGAYSGTVRGMRLPVGFLENGQLLVPYEDEDSGGVVIARVRVIR